MIALMLKRCALVLLATLLLTACGGGGGGDDGSTNNSVTFETRLIGIEMEDTRTSQVIGARELPVDGATITRN